MICIFLKKHTVNLPLPAAMGKGKYPDLPGFRDCGSELALILGNKEHHWPGFMRSDEKWNFGLCLSHSCLSGSVTLSYGYFCTLRVRVK